MIELDPALVEELDRIAPAVGVRPGDWPSVRRRARPRGRLLVCAVGALVLAAVPAVGLSAGVRSFLGLDTPVRPDFAAARRVVAAPLPGGGLATVWVGPSNAGGECEFVTVTRRGVPPQPMNGGGSCTLGHAPLRGALAWSFSRASPPVLGGRVGASARVARVELRWHGGRRRLAYAHGFFVAAAPEIASPPFAWLPYDVVALDRAGAVVARSRIPTSFLYRGWKRVEPALHRYRVAHGCDRVVLWQCRTR